MPKFDDQELGVSFSVPDAPTVRQVLRYDSLVELASNDLTTYERIWLGVKVFAEEWECDHVQPDSGLDEIATPEAIEVMKYAGLVTYSYRLSLKEVEKN